MNKRMRELKALIESKIKEAKNFMTGENKDVAKATALLDEIDKLNEEFDTEKRLFEAEKGEVEETAEEKAEEKKEVSAIKAFADAARNGFRKTRTYTDNNEGTGADGGYTVPEDIVTTIERYRDAKFSLRDLVRVVKVNTKSGARTFKKRKARTGFSKVLENGKFASAVSPQFDRLSYTIDKFGGYFVMTDEVVEDSDENIVSIITEDIADEARITDNVQILAELESAIDKTDLSDLDGIKNAVNVTLGQAFAPTAAVITNDNGLQYLDTLVDANGNQILKSDPTEPLKKYIAIGFNLIPLHIIPNADFANFDVSGTGDGIPFIIGDLNEGFVLWDRRQITLLQSNTASVGSGDDAYNAFEQGGRIIRADMRADYTVRDADAIVLGYIVPEA